MRAEEAELIHDMRMPAQMMVGCAALLRDAAGAEREKYAELLNESGAELVRLIDRLLAAGRGGETPLRIERLDMAEAVERCCVMATPYARLRGVALICAVPDSPVFADFDRERLRRMLLNLISNGVKFTPEGGRVAVRLEHGGGELCLSVTDTGIGVTEKALGGLLDGPDCGVGLNEVKRFAAQQGASVRAERAEGGGMRFSILFSAPEEDQRDFFRA